MTAGLFRISPRIAAIAVVFALSHSVAPAGTAEPPAINEILVLVDGERVLGASVSISEGTLRWRMPYGSEIEIPLALVDRIEQVPPDELDATADESAEEAAEPAPEEQPSPEEQSAAEKKSNAPKSDPAVEPAAASDVAPVLDEPLPLTVAWFEAGRSSYAFAVDQTGKWTKRFELGGSWVDGNSETSEVYIGGQFERQFDHIFHQLDWNGRHGTAGQEVTISRWQFNGTTDFSKNSKSKWILFLTHRHLFDELAELDYRGTFAGGIGYRFINEGEKRLIFRIGPGGTVEKYGDPIGTRVTQDLFAEAEAKWPVFDRTILEYKSTFTPSMDDMALFRMTSNYGVLVRLDERESWAMRVGLLHNHNSQPNAGTKKDDFTTTFSLVYTRK